MSDENERHIKCDVQCCLIDDNKQKHFESICFIRIIHDQNFEIHFQYFFQRTFEEKQSNDLIVFVFFVFI